MARYRKTAFVLTGLAALAVYAGAALQVHHARAEPELPRADGRDWRWLLGPPAGALEEAAKHRIDAGAASLNDRSLPPPERVRAHREQLERAEALLVRALRARPNHVGALTTLAAVRWELEPPITEGQAERILGLITRAAELAPTAPMVQLRLGELLLRMNRREDGFDYLSRAIELNPGVAAEMISRLREIGIGAHEILSSLPPSAELLVALERSFAAGAHEAVYVAAVERELARSGEFPERLLAAYANASLRLGRPEDLIDGLERLGERTDAGLEAQRLKQLSRAWLALEHEDRARRAARQARELMPDSFDLAGHMGLVLTRSGAHDAAILEYREALGLLASRPGRARARAKLYTRIGQVEERRGNAAGAYDAYRMAVRLDPDAHPAARRIEQMESAAGIR